jgi:hypothetical protein
MEAYMSKHLLSGLGVFLVVTVAVMLGPLGPAGAQAKEPAWSVKAEFIDSCSCKPSCPCFFGSAPTLGFCEGMGLVSFKEAHLGDVNLDGIDVVAVYRGRTWLKFYVSDKADEAQTKAAVELLPTFDEFFAIDNVLEVQNVPITVEREGEQIKVSVPNSMIEIEVMKGKNGKPIKIDNLPWTGFPGPPLLDHTQYKSVVLKHEGGEEAFEHSGTNGVTARFDTDSEAGE